MKIEPAKRGPNLRKQARIREKKLVFGEKKLESAERSPNRRKEACFGEKKIELAKRSPKNIQRT
jgi:hypothetical protein